MTAVHTPKLTTEADRTSTGLVASVREAQGLSQTARGQVLGVTFRQVQKYETGRNCIGAGRLRAIAEVLHVPGETFFRGQSVDGGSGTATFLGDQKVMELVLNFRRISDETTRESVLSIVKMAATIQHARTVQA